jgi:hypothetical protein
MAATLYVVRRKQHTGRHHDPGHNQPPFGIEATFTDRASAESYHQRREQEEETRADWSQLRDLMYSLWFDEEESIRSLSDFEPEVFDDWLTDHDIPDPDAIWEELDSSGDPVGDYFEALGPEKLRHLYAALHRFRFFEVLEVPLVVGDYPPERREAWENALPAGPAPPPGVQLDAAMNQIMLQQTLIEIADAFGLDPTTPAPDDDSIPF